MHFLSGLPRIDGRAGESDLPEGTAALVARVGAAWPYERAPRVRLLPRKLSVEDLATVAQRPAPALPIGLNETHLAPVYLVPEVDQHLVVFGDAECGKTNLLRLIARAIVERCKPEQARLVVVDYRRTLLGAVPADHLLDYAPSAAAATEIATGLLPALQARLPGPDVTAEQLRNHSWWSGPDIFILVDDYDLVAGASSMSNPLAKLAELIPQARDIGLHLVIARRSGGAGRAGSDPLLGKLRELDSPGLVMSGNRDEGALVGPVRPSPLPPGRGVLVRRTDGVNLVQTAHCAPPL
jgi:S-DNA-T family DNA segregation ATPase FtsK/SpoIIIE